MGSYDQLRSNPFNLLSCLIGKLVEIDNENIVLFTPNKEYKELGVL